MINLLPPDTKKQLYAARSNTLLVRYNFLLLGAMLFIAVAVGLSYLYLSNTKAANEEVMRVNTAKEGDYAKVQAQAKQFRENLKADKSVLDQSFSYTELILAITKLLPNGVVASSLTLDTKTFGTETTFNFKAKSYNAALELKDAFQNSPLFSDSHFATIYGSQDATYPINVTMNVTIKKEVAS